MIHITIVFIHESIKTRVETQKNKLLYIGIIESLSMNPLKQGLKPNKAKSPSPPIPVFIHESIKTRVETARSQYRGEPESGLYP